jgi:pimeloyl-ACP methyl ester carboxylesterase
MQPLTVASNGIEIAYETFGAPGGRPLLLVTGLGAQMLVWHPELCAALAAEDFFVVRYDNRDVGLSTHLHDAPPPNLGAAIGGDFSSASYRVEDMANDGVGLLDGHPGDPGRLVHPTAEKPRGGGGVDGGYPEDHRFTRLPDGRTLDP